ncbi:uncharacterized protein C8orf88 isoform X3 [Oryzias melastigma]|uniref:uncharacterized protein C8orf88 isoform X3 n=1 Tax=Oryzias melastigma TaxID=30732 RepID=UPI000CF8218F|nr:uncharacterized protein C8orf88 isoform X3 [Oryzias melastigma]
MEVSRRRMIHKHLQPTRPLRRCSYGDCDLQITAAACDQGQFIQETKVDVEQLYSNVSLHEQKKGRISYSREFLMGLASCPEAKIKPPFLPENPIVLSQARDPGQLRLGEVQGSGDQVYML